jgi:Type IV secretory pathway, VirJ component
MVKNNDINYILVTICLILFSLNIHASASNLQNLPILEFPAESNSSYFVLLFSGDGGWKPIDQSISKNLQNKKVPVVALNIMKYLWNEKTPLQIAKDLEKLIDTYLRKWNKKNVVIMGYSMGAEVLPFALNQTNIYYLSKIQNLILIAPSQRTIFKIKLMNYISDDNTGKEVFPEIKKLKLSKMYCICDDKKYSLCQLNLNGIMEYAILRGGHHFDGDYSALNKLINQNLNLN